MMVTRAHILAFSCAAIGLGLLGAAARRYGWAGGIGGGTLGFCLGFVTGLFLSEALDAVPDLSSRFSTMSPWSKNLVGGALTFVVFAIAIVIMYGSLWLLRFAYH